MFSMLGMWYSNLEMQVQAHKINAWLWCDELDKYMEKAGGTGMHLVICMCKNSFVSVTVRIPY